MAEQPNIQQILAALAAQRPGGTPQQAPPVQQQPPPQTYNPYPTATPSAGPAPFTLPQPTSTGSLDLSSIKPVNSGSVSISDAVAKARGIAAERGLGGRDGDSRRGYRRSRSRSRSPPRMARESFRDNYNPYREERREDSRRNGSGYPRERSFSPALRSRGSASSYPPAPGRGFGRPGETSPPGSRGGEEGQETMTIDSSLVGLIIGRAGENLRRIETETSARVQFMNDRESSGPQRQCKITGTRAAREHAKDEIRRTIQENGNETNKNIPPVRTAGVKMAGSHQPALRAGEDATQIMVPNRTVGLIIGRGGETIRDLQERSQCHVNIVGEEKSVNGLRPVNLIGTPQAAKMAKDLIMEIVSSDTKSMANQGQGGGRDMNPRAAPGGHQGGGDAYGSDKINDGITVPSDAVGMIIGKGGETIKEMQASTGCKINVAPATGRDVEREIGLVGSRSSIEQAKRAIQEKVQAVQEKNRSREDQYPSSFNQPSYPSQSTQPSYSSSSQHTPQPQAQPPANGEADPYAAYGGYQNYCAMWYMAQQQQQQSGNQAQPQSQAPAPTGP